MLDNTTQIVPWYYNPSWWAAIGTLLAVSIALFIAVFGEWLKSLIKKPKLTISLELKPPDCHKIELTDPSTGKRICDSYYLRMKVNNEGSAPASDVEIKALKLKKKNNQGKFITDKNFLPLNLVWSHTQGRGIYTPIIHPKLFRHCDLCHTIEKNSNLLVTRDLLLSFDTFPTPNKVSPERFPTIVGPGEYKLGIVVAAANFKPKNWSLDIKFTGEWFDKEKEMFQKGLRVEVKE